MSQELQILIQACKRNDLRAKNKVYNLFSAKMFGICRRYHTNYAEAQDCFQDAFITAFEKIHQFDENRAFEPWLRKIMINTNIDFLRKKRFFSPLEDYNISNTSDDNEDITLDFNPYDIQKILQEIQNLPPQYNLVFNLYVFEDKSHKEIADLLNITEGTSKSNLSRAKKWLQNRLKSI